MLYRKEVATGAEKINVKPETPQQAKLQFEAQRRIVERLVTRVDVNADESSRCIRK